MREMPGIPQNKNRTDHELARGSSIPHVIGHVLKQVHPDDDKNTHKIGGPKWEYIAD